MEKIMRLTPAVSAAIIALFGGALVASSADAATASRGSELIVVAEGSSTTGDKVQGTAPHTGTGMGEATPPAAKLPDQMQKSPMSSPVAPDGVQGTAPHTGTNLGQETIPPAQTPGMSNPSKAVESPSGTSEDNVSKPEKKMGEKPTP